MKNQYSASRKAGDKVKEKHYLNQIRELIKTKERIDKEIIKLECASEQVSRDIFKVYMTIWRKP